MGFDGPLGERDGGRAFTSKTSKWPTFLWHILCAPGRKGKDPRGPHGMLKATFIFFITYQGPPCPELAKDRDQLSWEERGLASCPLGLRLIF